MITTMRLVSVSPPHGHCHVWVYVCVSVCVWVYVCVGVCVCVMRASEIYPLGKFPVLKTVLLTI